MKRIAPIEGLRAWLAFWVVICHVMAFAGYQDGGSLSGIPKLLSEGWFAVDVFIIVSGFVIFALLDRSRESYGKFICRRFFRLYPVYLLLFLLAIPGSLLLWGQMRNPPAYIPATDVDFYTWLILSEWKDWRLTIPAHLIMLHGVFPDMFYGSNTPIRLMWLGPAWSISLEWQFYLIAPVVFRWATSAQIAPRLILYLLCLGLIYAGHTYEWGVGFLPFHVEYFLVGAVSYFIYKRHLHNQEAREGPSLILPAVCLAWMLYLLTGKVREVIPLGLWGIFFALLLEPVGCVEARWVRPFFTRPTVQFLGKISYSIYLSHELVIVAAQSALIRFLPSLGQQAHFWVLLGATVPITIGVSALLYRFIERPAIEWGRRFTARSFIESPVAHRTITPACRG